MLLLAALCRVTGVAELLAAVAPAGVRDARRGGVSDAGPPREADELGELRAVVLLALDGRLALLGGVLACARVLD
mgnify:CR=1 FL=1